MRKVFEFYIFALRSFNDLCRYSLKMTLTDCSPRGSLAAKQNLVICVHCFLLSMRKLHVKSTCTQQYYGFTNHQEDAEQLFTRRTRVQ